MELLFASKNERTKEQKNEMTDGFKVYHQIHILILMCSLICSCLFLFFCSIHFFARKNSILILLLLLATANSHNRFYFILYIFLIQSA